MRRANKFGALLIPFILLTFKSTLAGNANPCSSDTVAGQGESPECHARRVAATIQKEAAPCSGDECGDTDVIVKSAGFMAMDLEKGVFRTANPNAVPSEEAPVPGASPTSDFTNNSRAPSKKK